MIKRTNVDIVDILLFAMLFLFIFELIFLNIGHLIVMVIWLGFIYFGKKKYHKASRKVLFWLGVFFLVMTILNTLAFKFLLFSIVIYFVVKWYKSKQVPNYHRPEFADDVGQTMSEQPVLFTNKWFGEQRTNQIAYEWQDVNIQSGIGDTIIDLSYTVIPKSEPVVVVRGLIGNVQIIVPYDVEVSVHHSVLFGSMEILNHTEQNTWNRVVQLQSKNYQTSNKRVKIFTSMLAGKVEVKRG